MKHWIHIGTQKAGSSFLRGLAAQISQVALARRQELNFFGFREDHSYQAYLACFPEHRPVLFENSPIYFRQGDKCASPLAETLGGKELLLSMLLRDPVEAIVSHHDMQLRQGFFDGTHSYAGDPTNLATFVKRNPHYLDRCRYMQLLQSHWLPRFPSTTFAIRIFEEFTARPLEVLRELAARSGLDEIGLVRADNLAKNMKPSSPLAHRLLVASDTPALRAVRRRAMAVPALRRLAERALFGKRQGGHADTQLADLKAELAENFRSDVAHLCDFLGRDSLPWTNFFQVKPLAQEPLRER